MLLEKDIPFYVKDSAYLRSLLNNEPFPDTGIEAPDGCAKKDLTIKSALDLIELLQTVRFWMVPEVLDTCLEFFHFAFDPQNQTILENCAAEFEQTIPLLKIVAIVAQATPSDRVKEAVWQGSVSVLHFVCEELQYGIESGLLLAVEADQVECLKYFHSCRQLWDLSTVLAAASNGSVDCLKYLVESGCSDLCKDDGYDKLLSAAASAGLLSVVEYLWDDCSHLRSASSEARVCLSAASHGHVNLLQFAHSRAFKWFASPPLSAIRIVAEAAYSGKLNCLEYLYSIGQRANTDTLFEASWSGELSSIRFLLEHNCPLNENTHPAEFMLRTGKITFQDLKPLFEIGLPWDATTMAAVAETGSVQDMQYLLERGCAWDEWTCSSAAMGGHVDCLRFARENGCPWKVAIGALPANCPTIAEYAVNLECVQYVIEQGIPPVCETAISALKNSSFPALKYLLSVGCPVDARVSAEAAKMRKRCPQGDHVVFLRLLREHGCPWDISTCRTAARKGDLQCLAFAHENGCPWDASVSAAAASGGSLVCVQYAHTHGCPWDESTCAGAGVSNSYDILRYAREHGCPWDASTPRATVSLNIMRFTRKDEPNMALEFLKHLHEQGCPWDEGTCREACFRCCYDYAVANGCPGAELSRFSDPTYTDSISLGPLS